MSAEKKLSIKSRWMIKYRRLFSKVKPAYRCKSVRETADEINKLLRVVDHCGGLVSKEVDIRWTALVSKQTKLEMKNR